MEENEAQNDLENNVAGISYNYSSGMPDAVDLSHVSYENGALNLAQQ